MTNQNTDQGAPLADKPLAGRVTLVTGASRGIGYAAALALATAGSHIIATARTQGGLEDLDDAIRAVGGEATLVPMDLKQADGLDHLAVAIAERWGRLDGVFGNAGMLGEITLAHQTDPKIFDDVFAVNMTANFRLIRALDPLLRRSKAGRALFMSSGVAQTHRAYWSTYAASKAALETFVSCYAKEVHVAGVNVNVLNPGAMRTHMRAKAMPGENPDTLPRPADIAPLIVQMLSADYAQTDTLVNFRDTKFYTPAP